MSSAEQTILDEFCAARSDACKKMLAESQITITDAKSRYDAAKATLADPDAVPSETYDDFVLTILGLIQNE